MGDLKKQSQFCRSGNEHKVSYNKEIWEIYWIGHLVKTNPIQSQFKFYRGERRVRRVKGNMCKLLPNKEIRSTYYFSAVFANSAVNEKTKPILGKGKSKNGKSGVYSC